MYVCIRKIGIEGILRKFFYYSNSQYMELPRVVDLRLVNYKTGITRNASYLRVLSRDLQVFTEINKYILVVASSNVSNIKVKRKSMRGQIWNPSFDEHFCLRKLCDLLLFAVF